MRRLFVLASVIVLVAGSPGPAAADPFDHFGGVGDWTIDGATLSPTDYICMALGRIPQKQSSDAYAVGWVIRGNQKSASSYFQAQTELSENSGAKVEILFDGHKEVEAVTRVHLMALQAMLHDPNTLADVMQKFASSSQVSARIFSEGHGITTVDVAIEHGAILVEKNACLQQGGSRQGCPLTTSETASLPSWPTCSSGSRTAPSRQS